MIMLVFIAFSLMMGFLVYKSTRTKFELVSKDYYKDELAYQEIIDGSNNASTLSAKLNLQVLDSTVQIVFPKELQNAHLKGKLLVYCPYDETRDLKMIFDLNPGESLAISKSQVGPGTFILKVF